MNKFSFWARYKLREQAGDFLKFVRKQQAYHRDLLLAEHGEQLAKFQTELSGALKNRSLSAQKKAESLQGLLNQGERLLPKIFPNRGWDGWRENVEVIFVAIVAALAIRSFFFQPFVIPTDSMKPTLYGIQTVTRSTLPPSFPQKIIDYIAYGRVYCYLNFDQETHLTDMRGGQFLRFFEYTDLTFANGETHRLWASLSALEMKLGLQIGQRFSSGQTPINFISDTGDHVLVNKWIYNFRLPTRGEVFVFRTTNIEGIEASLRERGIEGSQFYIKRCVGLPGDELRITPPLLLNHETSDGQNFAMKRVESAQNGYRGYGILSGQNYLRSAEESHLLAKDEFWAMGDNSYNSLDSRFWGAVPRENLVGTGSFVYWPFGSRWGLIR